MYLIPNISINKITFSILMGKEIVKEQISIGLVVTKDRGNYQVFEILLWEQ